jgi:hypothetical protein
MNGNKPSTSGMSKFKRNVVLRQHADKERNEWKKNFYSMRKQRDKLLSAAKKVISENMHLADGDDCTLKPLIDAIAKAEQS